MREAVTAFVGVGANLGDPVAAVRAALERLRELPATTVAAQSSLYRTAPVDSSGPDYVNAVARLSTQLTAPELLRELQRLENAAGRERPYRNAPRTLDLDLLMFGNARIVGAVEKFKSFLDDGAPTFIQLSAVAALENWPKNVEPTVKIYQKRRDHLIDGMNKLGWAVTKPKATMYVWAQVPEPFREMGSLAFAEKLIRETGIAVAPGVGFGAGGEGYIRMSLVTHDNRFHDVLLRFKKLLAAAKTKVPSK